jgi:hypothetical protein
MDRGDDLPSLRLSTAAGETWSTAERRGRKTAFAVVSATCEACWLTLRSAYEQGPDPLDEDLTADDMVIVCLSTPDSARKLLDRASVPDTATVVYDVDSEVRRVWGVNVTPYVAIVDADMRVVRQVYGAMADGGSPSPAATASGVVEMTQPVPVTTVEVGNGSRH